MCQAEKNSVLEPSSWFLHEPGSPNTSVESRMKEAKGQQCPGLEEAAARQIWRESRSYQNEVLIRGQSETGKQKGNLQSWLCRQSHGVRNTERRRRPSRQEIMNSTLCNRFSWKELQRLYQVPLRMALPDLVMREAPAGRKVLIYPFTPFITESLLSSYCMPDTSLSTRMVR